METPPPPGRYSVQLSTKKRIFPGGSSTSKLVKQKEDTGFEVYVDSDEDSGDVMVVEEKANLNNKGKEPLSSFAGTNSYSANVKIGVLEPCKSSDSESYYDDFPCNDEYYMDACQDNLTYDKDEALQTYFDSRGIPPGDEAPIPWFLVSSDADKPPCSVTSSNYSSSTLQTNPGKLNPPFNLDLTESGTDSSVYSNPQPEMSSFSYPYTVRPRLFSPPGYGKYTAPTHGSTVGKSSNYSGSTLQTIPEMLNPPFNLDFTSSATNSSLYSNPRPEMGVFSYPYTIRPQLSSPPDYGTDTPPTHGSTIGNGGLPYSPADASKYTPHYSLHFQTGAMRPSYGFGPSYMASYAYDSSMISMGIGGLPYSPAPPMFPMPPPPMASSPSSMGTHTPAWLHGFNTSSQPPFVNDDVILPIHDLPLSYETDLSYQFSQDPANNRKSAIAAGGSSGQLLPKTNVNEKDVLEKFRNFKQFDIVEDFSDHHFQNSVYGVKQPLKDCAKRIQEEWKILEKNLPDTIHVRVYESRMDLLRAVIVGAEGTPYQDGVFFFDLFFPSDYPNVPPLVKYHSGGLRINPNLYHCGKVCLSLLNTWDGYHQNEQWIPGVSTILQVLVSIQALILNEKPFFNEPGFKDMEGSPIGEMQSQQYNERVFILSLRTMVYSIRKPPKHFEDFVIGHFFKTAEDIFGACKAHLEGLQAGCLVNGTAQDSDDFNKHCSQHCCRILSSYIPLLLQTFSLIGVKDLEKFLSLADKDNSQAPSQSLPSHSHCPVQMN